MPVMCKYCNIVFTAQFNLNKHCKNIHGVKSSRVSYDKSMYNFKCLELNCNSSFKFNVDLINHLQDDHKLCIDSEELEFKSVEEFDAWKDDVERMENCSYVMPRGERNVPVAGIKIKYFVCNRSAAIKPRNINTKNFHGDGRKRVTKSQGSCKLNNSCINQMTITIRENKTVHMKRCKTHYGHTLQLQHLRISNKDQHVIASKLISGVSKSKILDTVRDNIGSEHKRIDLLTREDIDNIKNKFKVNVVDGIRHKDDATSIDLWVEESKNSANNPILLYKQQGESLDSLGTDDFCLIIMNDFQKDMLKKFGHNVVCVDGTHGLNDYDFELNTLMVIDEFGEGFPVAIMFSNRKDTYVYLVFFKYVRDKAGVIFTNTFMSDLANSYYNAWQSVMGSANNNIYCSWHVDHAWQKNLTKIVNKDKRDHVYKTLKVLQQTLQVTDFEEKLQLFIKFLLEDEETEMFGSYFLSNYSGNRKQWAYCYRKSCGINTNMHLESMHKVLKYFYLERKKVKRLDKGLHAVLKYIRDKTVERLIKQTKGKNTVHSKQIFDRHRAALASSFQIRITSDTSCTVQTDDVEYIVQKVNYTKCCNLTCSFCDICVHMYSCTCADFFIKNTICKHIHFTVINSDKTYNSQQHIASSPNTCTLVPINFSQDPCIKQSAQEKLKDDLLNLHSKVSQIDFEKLEPQILKDINAHVKVINNLLTISKVQVNNIFQTKSLENSNKIIKKQIRFHSTKKKSDVKHHIHKKPSQQESQVLEDLLSGNEMYLSHSHSYDHSYL